MNRLSDQQKIEIFNKYSSKEYTYVALSKEYNVTPFSISQLLKRRGVQTFKIHKTPKKYSLDHSYFDCIDTECKAYFLGLLYADGYIHEKRHVINLDLQEEDKHILDEFLIELKSNNILLFRELSKKNPIHKNSYRLHFSSINMTQKLKKLGCFQNKSLTLKFPTEEQVPNYLIKHFLRGMHDGDGCFCYGKRLNYQTHFTVNLTTTKDFLERMRLFLIEQKEIEFLKFNHYRIGFTSKNNTKKCTRVLVISGKKCFYYLEWLYTGASIFFKRKYDKYILARKETFPKNIIFTGQSSHKKNAKYL